MIAAAMTTHQLSAPTYVDLAKAGSQIVREVPVESCLRLAAQCKNVASAEVQLRFFWDGQSRVGVDGSAVAVVELECQLCMEPVARRLQASVQGVLARSEIEAQAWRDADESLEIIVVSGPQLDILELVEDELLLHLPSQVCDDSACDKRPALSYGEDDLSVSADTHRPFAALAGLIVSSDSAEEQ
jgi:uncharacterized protein